ncbi:MAG: hypothetical protein V2A70_00900 [Candidatus Omnitrophota bacterium]
MADMTNIKFLYPPNFEGTYPEGTPNGHRKYIVQCTNISDGSGEHDAIKLKRTDLLTADGNIASKLVIEKVEYDVSGMMVEISYDNMNDEVAAMLQNSSGCLDFTKHGGFVPQTDDSDIPGGGNIIFNTGGGSLGDTYNIILTVRVKD